MATNNSLIKSIILVGKSLYFMEEEYIIVMANITKSPLDDVCSEEMFMYFHVQNQVYILFRQLCITSDAHLAAGCIATAVLAILYEGLKALRDYIQERNNASTAKITPSSGLIRNKQGPCTCHHFVQSVLHAIQTFLGMCLMMIFMTFNVYLCLGVCLGAGVGYYVFGWMRSSATTNEHCM